MWLVNEFTIKCMLCLSIRRYSDQPIGLTRDFEKLAQ